MVLGVSNEQRARIPNVLNCREGVVPIKYLGIPISKTHLYSANLVYVGVKVEKRLPTWQGLYLSLGGSQYL
jgi:hypothetical protein